METPALERIAAEHRNSARMIGDGERFLARCVEEYLKNVEHEGTLVRHVVYFLSHCGAKLTAPAVALITGRTERNVRRLAALEKEEFRKTVTFSPRENAGRPPKVGRRLIPVITEYLLTERVTSKAQLKRFLSEERGLSVSLRTLGRLLEEYDLERLIQRAPYKKAEGDASPLFQAQRASPAPGS